MKGNGFFDMSDKTQKGFAKKLPIELEEFGKKYKNKENKRKKIIGRASHIGKTFLGLFFWR